MLGRRARTFHVSGHHYALVVVTNWSPAPSRRTRSWSDGAVAWPPADGRPPSAIHTRQNERQSLLVFGSCRVGAPQRAPYTSSPADDPAGLGVDALWAYSRDLQAGPSRWPDGLILLGDQVYADEVPPETAAFIQARRDIAKPPGTEIADFEEYTHLYRESWSDPDIRWLLSTVPTTMIFDDHDVNDDWNISQSWVEEMRALPWWDAAHNRGVHVVLALPASRQPVAARARRRGALPPRPGGQRRRPAPPLVRAASATASRPQAAGRTTATSAVHASS